MSGFNEIYFSSNVIIMISSKMMRREMVVSVGNPEAKKPLG
jgi:hypothetical protein